MRLLTIAALLAALPWAAAQAAPTWQTISSEPGKRIELDRTSIKREEGGVVQAQGRVILERELNDVRSGAGYRVIEAITRYDCATRNANTIKRIYKKNETEVIREEEIKGADMPVRSGTLDDKVLREVCRPGKESVQEVAEKANAAAAQLKLANEELIRKETGKAGLVKTSETASPIPSIRPNLKAAVEAAQKESAKESHKETASSGHGGDHGSAKPTIETSRKQSPVTYYTSGGKATPAASHTGGAGHAPARVVNTRPARAPAGGGYMLQLAMAEPAIEHAHIHWSYEGEGGPDNWVKIDPKNKACAGGQRQSPIDIRDGIKVDLEPIRFDYRPSTFRIIDNGHTVQVALGDGSITLTGKTYELVQFHFHKPSEEKINGRGFDMVAHLVHKADDGQLAVVAVLMERGSENPFIQALWNNMPLEKNVSVNPPDTVVDLAKFLPGNRNYYTYMGSLTTPPCTEGVLWLVMKEPVQVSQEQINIFSRLYPRNARPIQPAAGRLVKEGR